jgi:hypothetical protein
VVGFERRACLRHTKQAFFGVTFLRT